MFTRLSFFVILLGLAPVAMAERDPGGSTRFNAYTIVYRGTMYGQPQAGVDLHMTVLTYEYVWPDEYNYTYHNVYGTTDANGYCYLYVDVPNADYDYLSYMRVDVVDPDFVMTQEQGNYSDYYANLNPRFVVILDRDRDGIDDDTELQIAEKFKPVLHKHSYDLQQNLENFENLLTGGFFSLIVYNDLGQLLYTQQISGGPTALHQWDYWYWDTYGHGSYSQGNYNLDLNDSKRYQGAVVGQRPLYYHVYKDASFYYVQYWYYFGMDDKREQLNGIHSTWHESDWEHVSLRLVQNPANAFDPDAINFYIHDGGWTTQASDGWWSSSNNPTYNGIQQGYSTSRTHLHVWIAANGHASYNRYQAVYKRSAVGVTYQDRIDYEPAGFDLYFAYDQLISMGEVIKQSSVQCPDSHYWLGYHVYPSANGSRPWLAYVGRTGDFDDPIFVGSPSPTMPANESISHEWSVFTAGFSGFGNGGAQWVNDDNTGD